MSDLEAAVSTWRHKPFPSGSANDALDELHADLALADTWVAEAVIPFVDHGTFQPAQVDVIGETRKLRDRAAQLGRSSSGEDKTLADAYRDYAALLMHVYESFLTRASSKP